MEERGAVRGMTGEVAVAEGARLPVFGHQPFQGTYRARLEASGRLALPSAFKAPFADAAIVRARRDEHLMVWTQRGFDAVVDAMAASSPSGMLDPRTRQRFYKSSPRVGVDRQSRFVLPPELRRQVGLEGELEVVLTGAIECIEIWSAERFDAEEAQRFDDVDLLFDGHSGLPTDPV